MSGNKKNNGVHLQGTNEITAAYKGDTPGQTVDVYLKLAREANIEKKKERSKNFSQVFDNPLKGFPYNEDFTVRDMNEEIEAFMEGMDFWKVTVTKSINKLKKGQSVIVKARNSSEALTKGAKNMGDPKANMSGYMDAVKDTKFPTNTSATQGKRMGESSTMFEEEFLKDYYSQKPKGDTMDNIEEVLSEGKNLIPDFQEIVNTKGAKKIGGIMVDMFTASVITQAYEKVSDKNKAQMENSDVKKLVGLAQRIMGMKEGSEYKAVANPTDATSLKGADGKKLYDTAVGKGIKEESQNLNEKPNMDGQKLTGQEISVYFRKNKVTDEFAKLAVKIALDHGGAMNYAIKEIEKLKRGLSKHKDVKKALDYANFGENTLPKIGIKFKD